MYAFAPVSASPADEITRPERLRRRPVRGLRHRATARPVLMPRDEGRAVRELQRKLASLGYDAGPADGVYGERLARAVCAFRADHPRLRQNAGYTDLLFHAALEDCFPRV